MSLDVFYERAADFERRKIIGRFSTFLEHVKTLKDGDFFGEIAILLSTPRTATVRAKTGCDLFVLDKADFQRILHDHPQFADGVAKVARERYNVSFSAKA